MWWLGRDFMWISPIHNAFLHLFYTSLRLLFPLTAFFIRHSTTMSGTTMKTVIVISFRKSEAKPNKEEKINEKSDNKWHCIVARIEWNPWIIREDRSKEFLLYSVFSFSKLFDSITTTTTFCGRWKFVCSLFFTFVFCSVASFFLWLSTVCSASGVSVADIVILHLLTGIRCATTEVMFLFLSKSSNITPCVGVGVAEARLSALL